MQLLRKSTATTLWIGPFLGDPGGTTQTAIECSSATIIDIYKGVAKTDLTTYATSMAHVANGVYSFVVSTSNTDTAGFFAITGNVSGAIMVWHNYMILPTQQYDTMFGDGGMAAASTIVGVAQASAIAVFSASVFSNLSYASTVAGVAQASAVAAVKVETASVLVWVQNAAMASTVAGVAQASAVTALSGKVDQLPQASALGTLADVANASTMAVFSASVFANLAYASALAEFSASAMLNLAYGSTVSANTDASVVWAYATRTLTAGGSGDTATTIWAYPQGSTVGYAYGSTVTGVAQASSLAVFTASVFANLSYASTVAGVAQASAMAAVKVETASVLVWVQNGAMASTVNGVAQASALATFSASAMANLAYGSAITGTTDASVVWAYASRTLTAGGSGDTATAIWAYTVGSAPYSFAMASTVAGVAQASSFTLVASTVWEAVRAEHTTAGTFGEVASTADMATAVWAYATRTVTSVTDGAQASTLAGVAQASAVAAVKVETASVLTWVQNAAMASTVTGVAQASSVAAFSASVFSTLASHTVTLASTLVIVQNAAMASTVTGVAQASSLAVFSASVFANLAYASSITGTTDASVVWAYASRTLTAGGSGDTATTIWAYPQGSAVGYAYGSTLAAFSASAMLNLAYGSSVSAVKTETASVLVWVQNGAMASTVAGVAQASSLAAFSASVFSTLASHTVTLASTLIIVQNAAMASTVNGVAQASSLAAFGASAMLNLAYGSAVAAVKTETASVLIWVQNGAMASAVDGVAQASALAAFSVSAMLNLAYGSTVVGVAQASTMAAFSASVMANVAYGSAVTGVASSMLATLYEGTHTFSDYLRITGAVMAGKTSGGGTASVMFFSIDGVTARVAAVVDANNNRSSVVTVTT